MDWGRFLAAQAANHIRDVEERRIAEIAGLIKNTQLTQRDWEEIAEHERILAAWPVNPE